MYTKFSGIASESFVKIHILFTNAAIMYEINEMAVIIVIIKKKYSIKEDN